MKILICIPVCNEEKILKKNIELLLDFLDKKLLAHKYLIVLAINNSNDNSEKIAQELKIIFPEKIDFFMSPAEGKGGAILETFNNFSAHDILVYMDADLAVSLDNIPELLLPLINYEADMVIASRLLADSLKNRSWFRHYNSKFYNFIARKILKHPYQDLQCGFKAMSKDLFIKVEKNIVDRKWFFDTELVYIAHLLSAKILEIAVDWQENRYQKRRSKVNLFTDSWSLFFSYLHSGKD